MKKGIIVGTNTPFDVAALYFKRSSPVRSSFFGGDNHFYIHAGANFEDVNYVLKIKFV